MENKLAGRWGVHWQSWQPDQPVPDLWTFLGAHSSATRAEKLAVLLSDQPYRWRSPQPLHVEEYLQQLPELATEPDSVLQLAVGEFQARQSSGDTAVSIDEFTERFGWIDCALN